jgi:pimeloyl-ACP methyl ester carboxylesterase
MWSPTWAFDDATFDRTAGAFDNPDFVDVVIHSYRHRYGLAPGDPQYAPIEGALAEQPAIAVPAITIDGDADGVNPGTSHHTKMFAGPHEHRIFKNAGHNLPQERPEQWTRAIIDAQKMASS